MPPMCPPASPCSTLRYRRKIPPGGSYSQVFAALPSGQRQGPHHRPEGEKGMDNPSTSTSPISRLTRHGLAAARYYLTPMNSPNDIVAGKQSFPHVRGGGHQQRHGSPGPPIRCSRTSVSRAVQVAVGGHAMQHYKARSGDLYPGYALRPEPVVFERLSSPEVHHTVKGFAKPKVVTWRCPKDMDSNADGSCDLRAADNAGASCDAAEHVAWSGHFGEEWKGRQPAGG